MKKELTLNSSSSNDLVYWSELSSINFGWYKTYLNKKIYKDYTYMLLLCYKMGGIYRSNSVSCLKMNQKDAQSNLIIKT